MNRLFTTAAALALAVFVTAGSSPSPTRAADPVLQTVDDFQLTDHTRLAHRLYYFGYAPAIVLMSTSPATAHSKAGSAQLQKLAEAYAAKGFNLYYGTHEFDRSAAMFEEALKRDPDSAQTLHWYALTSMHTGEHTRPLQLIERALRLAPDSRTIRANRALILYYAGRASEAITALEELRQVEPTYLATPSYLATIYLDQGQYGEFLRQYEEAARVEGNSARTRIAAAAREGLRTGGGPGFLRAMLSAQEQEYAAGAEPAYKLAVTAALLGDDDDAALGYLETAVTRAEPDTLSIRIEPAFERYYRDPRFVALVEKVGFKLPG
jgi:tetratricopeptide (TPR) repeat protein